VGVGTQGGKIRLGGGEEFFDVLVNGGLVIFGRQQIIGAGLQHQRASGLGLGMQSIQRDEPAFQIHALKELACHGNFVGLGFHNRAGQVILARRTDRGEHVLAAAVFGFFAVQGDQLVFGCWAA